MNISLLASLVSNVPQAAASAGSSASTTPDSGAQFKAQFDQAVTALTTLAAGTNGANTANASSGSGSTSASAAGGSAAALATLETNLQVALQKKINDMLASGTSVSEIVQQLAAALANAFAAHFGGDPAQIQAQLQSAFTTALSPSANGPPASNADLASALAQQFVQVANTAAGVLGETGQSNRLFAGSLSDAATTAGGQPAPGSTNGTTTTTTADATSAGQSGIAANADSIASNVSALLAGLTNPPGDGKTVAFSASALGSNGDTLLGRILTRAANASLQNAATNSATDPATVASSGAAPATTPANPATAGLIVRALAAATAALQASSSNASAAAAAANDPSLPSTATTALASASSDEAANLNPAVTAFVNNLTNALAAGGATAGDKSATNDGTATVLTTSVASAQAPTIGAFAPVQPAAHVDAATANPTSPPPSTPATDPTSIVDQVLRGAFLTTNGLVSNVRLRLVPDSLGDVNVNLTVNGSSVSAQVVAQTPAAHDALVAGQNQLVRALNDAGLKLTSFNVSLAGGFSSFQQQQQSSSQQQANSGRRLLLGGVDTPETDEATLAAVPSFAPPSPVIAGWGAFNYLV